MALLMFEFQSIYFSTSCQRTNIYKGPRISAELSLGRFIVLVPFSDRYFSKIEDKRKERLKKLYNPSNQKDLVLLFAQ
jgi:hypothetical protein